MALAQMKEQEKTAPSLRFPEFHGEWTVSCLGSFGNFKNGLNKDKGDFGHGVPFVNLQDVFGKNLLDGKNLSLVNASHNEIQNYNLMKGDVLFIRSSVKREGVGEVALVPHNIDNTVYSGFLIRFREDKNKLCDGIKKYCFATSSVRKQILSFATTSANTNINQETLEKIKIIFPEKPEQQKIASFLSAVDQKIAQLTRKKELLEEYKKGIMQKLFSQEIRFKDDGGHDFPDWEFVKISDVTSNFNKRNRDLIDADVYSVTNDRGFIPQSEQFEGTVAGDDKKDYKIIEKGDFAYNPARINVGSIAQLKDVDRVIISSLYVCFKVNENVSSSYFTHWLDLDKTKFDINRFGEGGVRIYLWYYLFALICFPLPSLDEQKEISGFLDSIDNKIDDVSAHLSLLQKFKKGLLQQMFV